MKRFLLNGFAAVVLFSGFASPLQGAPEAILLNQEVETLGVAAGVSLVDMPGAAGNTALALSRNARILWAVRLPAGTYTLLLRSYAPAGDQDGFFVRIDSTQTRRTARIGSWGVLSYPFTLERQRAVTIAILGQEPGVRIDRAALVKGEARDDALDPAEHPLTGKDMLLSLDEFPRLEQPCSLATPPQLQGPDFETAVYAQDFEMPVRGGIHGNHAVGPGKWGQALILRLPDGRLDVNLGNAALAATGTIAWWVRPRPAIEAWRDQGWRYFLHVGAAAEAPVRLDLSRHVSSGLQLSVSTNTKVDAEAIRLRTRSLDREEWHHILVSWDFSGETQYLWLMLDGNGTQLRMPKTVPETCRFTRLSFGNTPPGDDLPYLPMDGGLDHIRVTDTSVRNLLAE